MKINDIKEEQSMELQLAGKLVNSLANGEGMRYVLFLSGCPHHCEGCHNKHTWDPEYGDKVPLEEILIDIEDNMPIITGVTLSGGEPFEQPRGMLELVKTIKKLGLDIWCYTGYTLEQLIDKDDMDIDSLLTYIDVLVDGKFDQDLYDPNLQFRGSSNQRILKLKEIL
jgi:anaerobic ribonucleoside-triphosphate reductase activating protein